jgi:hypothetical protein
MEGRGRALTIRQRNRIAIESVSVNRGPWMFELKRTLSTILHQFRPSFQLVKKTGSPLRNEWVLQNMLAKPFGVEDRVVNGRR